MLTACDFAAQSTWLADRDDSQSNPDLRKITRNLSLTFATFGDTGQVSRPSQGGDGERAGLRSAKWTSTLRPSTVQLYVADSARRCDPDEVAADGFHESRASSWAIVTPFARNTRCHSSPEKLGSCAVWAY